jgi:hypothetical protein
MKRQLLLWLPAAAFSLALVGQVAYYRFVETPVVETHASWAFKPKNLTEAQAKAHTIVQGEVVSVSAGPDIVTKAPGEPNNEDRIPTQQIKLKVNKVEKGNAKVGQIVDVFQTGGIAAPSGQPDGKQGARIETHLVLLSDDPLYKTGEQYLLMLEDGPKGLLRTISPEGRFRIESNGSVTPMVDNEVTAVVKGKQVSELERQVTPALGVPTRISPSLGAPGT